MKPCTKKKFTLKEAKGFLKYLMKEGYNKKPWRDEMSYYICEQCGHYHVSKQLGGNDSITYMKEGDFFEFQKKKWNNWLQKRSFKKGHV